MAAQIIDYWWGEIMRRAASFAGLRMGGFAALGAVWLFSGSTPGYARITSITYTTSQPYGTVSFGSGSSSSDCRVPLGAAWSWLKQTTWSPKKGSSASVSIIRSAIVVRQ